MLDWFGGQQHEAVEWNWRELPVLSLCRRSIGRNLAAQASKADWVWFTDADYWFTTACWSAFRGLDCPGETLVYPSEVMTHKEHHLGDRLIEQAAQLQGLVAPDISEFEPRAMNRAIGGIQIVLGSVCREQGYLPGHSRAQKPTVRPVFEKNVADVWFRKSLGTSGRAVELPGVYRIRHSQNGREVPGLKL